MTATELSTYSEMDLLVMAMALKLSPEAFTDDGTKYDDCLQAITSEIQVREYRRLGYGVALKDRN